MAKHPYMPIDCDFHSELELRALRGQPCEIVWMDWTGRQKSCLCPIRDIFAREKEEFLLLPDGTEVRLDMIVSVDGLTPPAPTAGCSK